MLVNVPKLITAYYTEVPDPSESRTPDIASREMSAFVSRRLPDCVMQA
jgi:hypothetical protein